MFMEREAGRVYVYVQEAITMGALLSGIGTSVSILSFTITFSCSNIVKTHVEGSCVI